VRALASLALATVALAGGALLAMAPPNDPAPAAANPLDQARAFYGSQPAYLSPVVLGSDVPAGLPDLRAATCGACHQDIYAEWAISTHARAWLDDLQFQAELHKPRPDDGDVGWMCVNCHTPVEQQLERLVIGLRDGRLDQPVYVDNPRFDPTLQTDAITCATCHLRDGVIVGPYGDTSAPHATAKSDHLLTEEVCVRCHQAEADFPEIVLSCSFSTGREFAASSANAEGKVCQDCHMPPIERPLMAGFPDRPTRRHWFGGSLLPKKPAYEAELAPLRDVYPDGMTLAWEAAPTQAAPGAETTASVSYTNAEAGHRLPTGDPERFLLVTLQAVTPDGAVLGEETHRIGTVTRWYPTIERISDNRLLPGESRTLTLTFAAPSAGPLTLRATASKHRITEENLAYHDLVGKVPAGRVFWTDERPLAVAP